MPRLPTDLVTKAHRVSPLVALLLRACRDIPSAKNELRWISEHVSRVYNNNKINNTGYSFPSPSSTSSLIGYHEKVHLYRLCKSRSRGVPLQYILGTQPFGDLEIKCRRGVLIPRSETEAYTLELASRILLDEEIRGNASSSTTDKNNNSSIKDKGQDQNPNQPKKQVSRRRPVRILDICSGTGCISLQLYAQLRRACPDLEVVGLDVSKKAIDLSRENVRYNNLHSSRSDENENENGDGRRQSISYHWGDLFSPSAYIQEVLGLGPLALEHSPTPNSGDSQQQQQLEEPKFEWDLIVSNPPYISSRSFSRDTTRSVRNFEPKLALVPDEELLSTSGLVTASTSTPMEPGKRSRSLVSSCQPEDVFYARILDLFLSGQGQSPKRILFEVAGLEQASRAVEMMVSCSFHMNATIEIWRDDPSSSSSSYYPEVEEGDGITTTEEDKNNKSSVMISGREIPIRGAGNVRSVYFFAGTVTGAGERT